MRAAVPLRNHAPPLSVLTRELAPLLQMLPLGDRISDLYFMLQVRGQGACLRGRPVAIVSWHLVRMPCLHAPGHACQHMLHCAARILATQTVPVSR